MSPLLGGLSFFISCFFRIGLYTTSLNTTNSTIYELADNFCLCFSCWRQITWSILEGIEWVIIINRHPFRLTSSHHHSSEDFTITPLHFTVIIELTIFLRGTTQIVSSITNFTTKWLGPMMVTKKVIDASRNDLCIRLTNCLQNCLSFCHLHGEWDNFSVEDGGFACWYGDWERVTSGLNSRSLNIVLVCEQSTFYPRSLTAVDNSYDRPWHYLIT